MEYGHHGQTPAAWTASILVIIAFAIGTFAVIITNWWLFWIGGVALAVVGGLTGRVMSAMGYGMPRDGVEASHQ